MAGTGVEIVQVSGSDDARGGGSSPLFDPLLFMTMWRLIEGPLRRQVGRFGVPEHDVDDVMSEAFVRLFRARATVADERALLALADAVARRVVLDWMRRDARRAASLRRRGLTAESLSEPEAGDQADVDASDAEQADVDALDAEQAAVLRMAVEGKLAGLSRQERRAVALLRRGGPYTNAEKVAIHRGRKRLDEVFRDLLGGFAVSVGRWRDRFDGMRARFSDPNPLLPLLAGAASAVGLAGLAASAAAPGSPPLVRTAPAVGASMAAPAVPVRTPGAGVTVGGAGVGAVAAGRAVTAQGGSRGTTAGPVRVGTRLPEPETGGAASVGVTRDLGVTGGTTEVGMRVYCDTALRRTVCTVWSVVPAIPGT